MTATEVLITDYTITALKPFTMMQGYDFPTGGVKIEELANDRKYR